jgi:hypothetical protein
MQIDTTKRTLSGALRAEPTGKMAAATQAEKRWATADPIYLPPYSKPSNRAPSASRGWEWKIRVRTAASAQLEACHP